jgi:hypothetical protein
MTDNSHQFTRDAWEANAEVWNARMGDEGNDFFKTLFVPTCPLHAVLGGLKL